MQIGSPPCCRTQAGRSCWRNTHRPRCLSRFCRARNNGDRSRKQLERKAVSPRVKRTPIAFAGFAKGFAALAGITIRCQLSPVALSISLATIISSPCWKLRCRFPLHMKRTRAGPRPLVVGMCTHSWESLGDGCPCGHLRKSHRNPCRLCRIEKKGGTKFVE